MCRVQNAQCTLCKLLCKYCTHNRSSFIHIFLPKARVIHLIHLIGKAIISCFPCTTKLWLVNQTTDYTNPSHRRSSPTHWTSTGLPSQTPHHPAFCFSFSLSFLVDACVGLNWLSASFLSHVNQIKSNHSFMPTLSYLDTNYASRSSIPRVSNQIKSLWLQLIVHERHFLNNNRNFTV